jgi:hypothetical protein
MPRFEAVAGKTGLALRENSILLKREQDFAEDRWATGSFELGNSCQQVGQLTSTRWATRVDKMGKHQKTGQLIMVSHPVFQG